MICLGSSSHLMLDSPVAYFSLALNFNDSDDISRLPDIWISATRFHLKYQIHQGGGGRGNFEFSQHCEIQLALT